MSGWKICVCVSGSFSAGLKENQVAYAYLQAGDFYYLVGPVRFDSKVRLYYHIGEFEIPKSDFNTVFSSEFYFSVLIFY